MSTFLFWQAELLMLQAHLSKGPKTSNKMEHYFFLLFQFVWGHIWPLERRANFCTWTKLLLVKMNIVCWMEEESIILWGSLFRCITFLFRSEWWKWWVGSFWCIGSVTAPLLFWGWVEMEGPWDDTATAPPRANAADQQDSLALKVDRNPVSQSRGMFTDAII